MTAPSASRNLQLVLASFAESRRAALARRVSNALGIRYPASIAPGLLLHTGCHCPGCGQRQWNVGRITAECATCDTALIIAEADGLTHLRGELECPSA